MTGMAFRGFNRNAIFFLHITRFDLLLAGPDATTSPLQTACASLPVIELGREFSTLDAVKSARDRWKEIAARLTRRLRDAASNTDRIAV